MGTGQSARGAGTQHGMRHPTPDRRNRRKKKFDILENRDSNCGGVEQAAAPAFPYASQAR